MRSARLGDCALPPAGARRYEANHRGIEGKHRAQCARVRRWKEEHTLVKRKSWGPSNDGGLRMVNWESQSKTSPRVGKTDTFIVFYLFVLHIELPAKLLDYFLRSNTSNFNQFKKSRQSSKICTRRELPPPSLTRTSIVFHPLTCHPRALSSVFHMFEVCACTVLSEMALNGKVRDIGT